MRNVDIMADYKEPNQTHISKAYTIEEIGDFWDKNSLDNFWDETLEVSFNVQVRRHNYHRSRRE